MPIFEFIVEPNQNGNRIDSFLSRHLRNYTSWRLQRIVREGGATINFAPAEQTDRVFSGQSVRVRLIEPPDNVTESSPLEVPLVYSDPWMMVVNKPAGMIVHPVGEDHSNTLCNVLQTHLDRQGPCRGLFRPGIVHRLDRQTSGAIVVAKTHQAHVELSGAFEASRVAKTYLTLVEGVVKQDSGTIDMAIGRANTGRHVLMSCRADAKDRKPSRTNFEIVERFPSHTLLLAKPRTGRNHQIRVHFAAIGHPLVGDEFYESHGRFKPFRERSTTSSSGNTTTPSEEEDSSREVETGLPLKRHALHALKLELAHPVSGAWLEFTATPPEDFQQTIELLRASQSGTK